MTAFRTWLDERLSKRAESKSVVALLLLLFVLAPFQRRFHGAVDSFSRKLTLPDFPLPEFFSTKVHLYISDFLVLILAVVLLVRFKVSLRELFFKGPSKYLTLLFFTSLLSLYFSITRAYALQYFLLLQFSMIFLFFNSICCAYDKIDLALFVRRCAWAILCVSCFECAISAYQYFYQESIGLRFLGEVDIHHFMFPNPSKHRWLLDNSEGSFFLYRSSGTFSHPNILGGFLFCSLLASYYLCMNEESKMRRLLVLLTIPLQIFTLYIAYSRSAMVALAVATFFWCFLQFKHLIRKQGIKSVSFKRLAILTSLVVSGGLAGVGLFYSQLSARGGIVNYNQVSQFADSERIHYLSIAAKMIEDHPLLGVGFNNFQLCVQQYLPEDTPHKFFSKVHNIYLLIASEIGVIGCSLFLLFLLAISRAAYKGIFKDTSLSNPQEKFFLAAVFLGLLVIGVFDFYLLNTQAGRILFFGFSAMLYAISKTLSKQTPIKGGYHVI